MNGHRFHLGIIAAILLLSVPVFAADEDSKPSSVAWTKRQNARTGLYTTKNYFVSHGVTVSATAMYYFGDVDNVGVAFNGGFNVKNLSLGGGLTFTYQLPVSNHCNLRFNLMAGTLRGNNEEKFKRLSEPRDDYRKFNSVVIQPAFGVQYYPFSQAGFYLYGGIAVTASIITDYQFWYYKRVDGGSQRSLLQGKTFGFLPMVQLGIGYSWKLTDSWSMAAEVMLQQGVVDTHFMNLDAYPLAASQNSDGVELGSTSSSWTDKDGKKHFRWSDGWFQVGISVTYHWRNCERCRLLNNYSQTKKRRR